jgi:hypothetical protein
MPTTLTILKVITDACTKKLKIKLKISQRRKKVKWALRKRRWKLIFVMCLKVFDFKLCRRGTDKEKN